MKPREALKRTIASACDIVAMSEKNYAKRKRSICLMYHKITKKESGDKWSTQLDILKQQIAIVKDLGCTLARCDDILESQEPACCISFDDGLSDESGAFEYLINQKIPFTIFAVSSLLGKDGYLEHEEISELAEQGSVSIGSHSASHIRLDRLQENQLLHELTTSKTHLEQVCRKPVTMFSYPYGRYNRKTVSVTRKAGYKTCFTSSLKPIAKECDPLLVPRIEIWQDESYSTLLQKLRGSWGWTDLFLL